jgi:hypothetical protein
MVLLRSFRNSRRPSSICLPPAASAPDLMVRKPSLIGSSPCADAPRLKAEAAISIAADLLES